MTPRDNRACVDKDVAREASSYLEVVEVFAALGADPHATARARAARARANEQRGMQSPGAAMARKGVLRWRT
jgi:hypothetical protein